MAKLFVTLAILCVFGAVLVKGFHKSDLDLVRGFHDCIDETGVEESDLEEFFKNTPPSTQEGKCLRLCILKKQKLMDDNGKFLEEDVLEQLEKYAKMATEMYEKCSKIDVSDEPCDAAVQYAKCLKDETRKIKDKLGAFSFI